MSIWLLALLGWLVVFPVLVVAIAFLLATLWRRPVLGDKFDTVMADVVPLEPVRRRHARAASVTARQAQLRSDRTAPVA